MSSGSECRMFGTAILPARPGPGSLLRGDADDEASLVRSPEFSPASRGRGAFFFFLGLGRSSVAVLPLPSALGSTAGEAGLATPSPRAANGPAPAQAWKVAPARMVPGVKRSDREGSRPKSWLLARRESPDRTALRPRGTLSPHWRPTARKGCSHLPAWPNRRQYSSEFVEINGARNSHSDPSRILQAAQ